MKTWNPLQIDTIILRFYDWLYQYVWDNFELKPYSIMRTLAVISGTVGVLEVINKPMDIVVQIFMTSVAMWFISAVIEKDRLGIFFVNRDELILIFLRMACLGVSVSSWFSGRPMHIAFEATLPVCLYSYYGKRPKDPPRRRKREALLARLRPALASR